MQVPKSPVPMFGRGAKMINIINQKSSPKMTLKRRGSVFEDFQERDNKRLAKEESEQPRDYLKFSNKIVYNPEASPSSGILRKDFTKPYSSPLTSAKVNN